MNRTRSEGPLDPSGIWMPCFTGLSASTVRSQCVPYWVTKGKPVIVTLGLNIARLSLDSKNKTIISPVPYPDCHNSTSITIRLSSFGIPRLSTSSNYSAPGGACAPCPRRSQNPKRGSEGGWQSPRTMKKKRRLPRAIKGKQCLPRKKNIKERYLELRKEGNFKRKV